MQHEEEIVFGCLRVIIVLVAMIIGCYFGYISSFNETHQVEEIHENNQ